jgi:outer membrane protein TolC
MSAGLPGETKMKMMSKVVIALFFVIFVIGATAAQERPVTLKEAVGFALQQNPEIALARLNERKVTQAVRMARDPFVPKIGVGSGLAFSSGFPMSIEGATPSIMQAQATQFVFNRPQTYLVGQARENARGAVIDTAAKREEVAHRAAVLFLEAERARRLSEAARRQVESLERVAEVIRIRVAEGRELPIEAKRAALNLAKARQRAEGHEADLAYAEGSLAAGLGLDEGEQVRVILEDRNPPPLPPSEAASVEEALENSKELRRLESAIVAKGFEIRSHRAARLPRVDLVAQYALLGKFNNYEDFFRTFQRHNGQLGISLQVPLLTGPGVDAGASQAEDDSARLRLELQHARSRIALEARRLYRRARGAETAQEVARLDLDVARDQVSIVLAQMQEGRASLRQVEEARFMENEKWIAFFDSQYGLEITRLDLLKQTGGLLAALQ